MLYKIKKMFLMIFLGCAVLFLRYPGMERVIAAERVQETGENVVVVIDPGHGGENEGTIENGYQEKSMTLKTAKAMYDALSQYDGVTVYMTRTDDRDMTLKERAQFAKDVNADFLFSIHYNASPNHNLFGSEVWISSKKPFNAYGYQFGYHLLTQMEQMGLFLRGVKTRLNDKGTDYYGIIREAAAFDLPAVIIEHCHVDEDRDTPFCDDDEKLMVFGQTDARAVAQYFGLQSSSLGTDYSGDFSELPQAAADKVVESTLKDETPPDICMITLEEAEYDTGRVRLTVNAADYDSVLLYYNYSIDGGETYSPLFAWPDSNALEGSYTDTFTLELTIPSQTVPTVSVRAYNLFDGFTESNVLTGFQTFRYGGDETEEQESISEEATEEALSVITSNKSAQAASAQVSGEEKKEISILTFLEICLICAAILLVIVLFSQGLSSHSRRKRRQRRKEDGNRKNHPR